MIITYTPLLQMTKFYFEYSLLFRDQVPVTLARTFTPFAVFWRSAATLLDLLRPEARCESAACSVLQVNDRFSLLTRNIKVHPAPTFDPTTAQTTTRRSIPVMPIPHRLQ